MTEIPTVPNQLHSPRIGKPNGVPPPHYPGTDEFNHQLEEVIRVREQVQLDQWPEEFLREGNPSGRDGRPPEILEKSGIVFAEPKVAATYVAMDAPEDLGIYLFEQLVAAGVPFAKDYSFFPFHEEMTGFRERVLNRIRRAHAIGWEIKCFYGLERPETVLELPGCVFCGNRSGAPNHFSYVANHATGYGATYEEILDTFDFVDFPRLKMEVLDALWQGAMYRTLLGVHYRQDNEQGFIAGRTVCGMEDWVESLKIAA